MPWGGETRFACKICGRRRKPDELLTARGKHMVCSAKAIRANLMQLHHGAGPYYDRWKAALVRSLDAKPVED